MRSLSLRVVPNVAERRDRWDLEVDPPGARGWGREFRPPRLHLPGLELQRQRVLRLGLAVLVPEKWVFLGSDSQDERPLARRIDRQVRGDLSFVVEAEASGHDVVVDLGPVEDRDEVGAGDAAGLETFV